MEKPGLLTSLPRFPVSNRGNGATVPFAGMIGVRKVMAWASRDDVLLSKDNKAF